MMTLTSEEADMLYEEFKARLIKDLVVRTSGLEYAEGILVDESWTYNAEMQRQKDRDNDPN